MRDINLFDSSFDNPDVDAGHQPFCRCETSTFLIPVLTAGTSTFLTTSMSMRDINLFDSSFDNPDVDAGHQP
jgi:hypothetical protein